MIGRTTRTAGPQGPFTRGALLATVVVAGLIGLSACSSSSSDGATPTTDAIDAAGAGSGDRGASVEVGSTDLGDVLVDGEGRTLYLFTPDGTGEPSCLNSCADAWPPLVSKGEPVVEGVDADVIGTVDRADGSTQVTADGHPLYTYAGDTAPGDTSGQGSGGQWFVVGKNGAAVDTTDTSGGSGY